MAYDPNDPADKAIVDKMVKDAVDAAMKAAEEAHEAEVDRLKGENATAREKLRKARAEGGAENAGEIERLENELNEIKAKLATAEREGRRLKTERDTLEGERNTVVAERDNERKVANDQVIKNDLTAALVEANVPADFLDDLVRSMAQGASVKEVSGERRAFVGDLSAADHIKKWAEDKGKVYITAARNGGGGGTPPGDPQGGAKTIDSMSAVERKDHETKIGSVEFAAQLNRERAAAAKK